MTAHEQDFVNGVEVRVRVQRIHNLSEPLPLGSVSSGRTRVGLVYEAKVDCSLHRRVSLVLGRVETSTYVVKT